MMYPCNRGGLPARGICRTLGKCAYLEFYLFFPLALVPLLSERGGSPHGRAGRVVCADSQPNAARLDRSGSAGGAPHWRGPHHRPADHERWRRPGGSNTRIPPWSSKALTRMAKAGRNDPCPCGSAKKYKKCCQSKNEAAEHEELFKEQAKREERNAARRARL
jgi:hypothetical protein